jgi:hypothetical protein
LIPIAADSSQTSEPESTAWTDSIAVGCVRVPKTTIPTTGQLTSLDPMLGISVIAQLDTLLTITTAKPWGLFSGNDHGRNM